MRRTLADEMIAFKEFRTALLEFLDTIAAPLDKFADILLDWLSSLFEEWRPVASCPEYEVSNLGRVRRIGRATGATPGRVLKPQKNNKGYQRVSLSCRHAWRWAFVHQLVAFAFIGPRPEGMLIDHKDDNKERNRPCNLQYVTPSENTAKGRRANRAS